MFCTQTHRQTHRPLGLWRGVFTCVGWHMMMWCLIPVVRSTLSKQGLTPSFRLSVRVSVHERERSGRKCNGCTARRPTQSRTTSLYIINVFVWVSVIEYLCYVFVSRMWIFCRCIFIRWTSRTLLYNCNIFCISICISAVWKALFNYYHFNSVH